MGLWDYIEIDKKVREYGAVQRCSVCGSYNDIDDMERVAGKWICEYCYAMIVHKIAGGE